MIIAWGVSLVLLVYTVLDLARTPAEQVRVLPKPAWLLVLLVPLLGPVAWLLTRRPAGAPGRRPRPERGAPDDDEDFLRKLRREADDRRRRARDPRDDDV